MGSYDLFVLLNVLRPDFIIDQESFEHMAEPNPFINRAVDLARGQGTGRALLCSGLSPPAPCRFCTGAFTNHIQLFFCHFFTLSKPMK